MLPQHVLVALVAAVSAVPLNINLGAYSPALVVGDGEISLGSGEEASNLMQTLASGAAGGGGEQQQGQQQQEGQPAQEQPPERQEAQVEQPEPEQPEGEQEQPAENEDAANEGRAVPALNLRSLLGKRQPAPETDTINAVQDAMEWIKRDLAGFREALTYAREAQKEQPKVELGTGEAGSGVGVIVHPGTDVAAGSAANGAPPPGERREKRSEVVTEESETPKMTLVAITEV